MLRYWCTLAQWDWMPGKLLRQEKCLQQLKVCRVWHSSRCALQVPTTFSSKCNTFHLRELRFSQWYNEYKIEAETGTALTLTTIHLILWLKLAMNINLQGKCTILLPHPPLPSESADAVSTHRRIGITLLSMTTLLAERLPHMQKGPGLIPRCSQGKEGVCH